MSDRFATYPEMTESGDDLFCEIPASWDRLRIKQLFQIRKDIAGRLGYPVWSVTQHGLREKDITSGEGQLSMDYSKYQMLRVGDLVMNHMDLITGGVDIGWKEGVTSPDYRVFIPRLNAEVNKQFFVWLFRLCYWTKKFYSLGQGSAHLGRWRLPTRAFESIVVPVPTLDEQKQIASFLDYETAKIDALIEKQQQLIALLGEKRQAVISHAVTKGLNPDAPMRDSGIEWLGEVPEHWEVSRVKQITLNPTSGPYGSSLTKSMYSTEGIRVYGQQQAIANDFTIGDYYISPKKFAGMTRYEVFPGDVLITVMGTIGRVAVVPDDVERGIINPRLVRYQAQYEKTLPHFLRLSILGQRSQEWLTLMAQGSTMDGLNMQILGDLPIPFPDLDEQKAIIKEVKRQNQKFDRMMDVATRIVELLQERRTALISAAVTGKIDVRGWKPPSSARVPETEMEVA